MVKGIDLVFYRSLCRYSYDRNITCFQIGFQFINQAQAVHVGHDNITYNNIRMIMFYLFQSLYAVFCFVYHIIKEDIFQQVSDILFIFHYQYDSIFARG